MSDTERAASRRLLLEQAAVTVAAAWVERWKQELLAQGRPVVGGFPGTLSEVRGRVRATFAQVESRKAKGDKIEDKQEPFSREDAEHVAKDAYARARRAWLASAGREDA
ncbi:MAG: hypothetical protein U0174_07020 [Polyangiaceae bacterium]